MWAVWFVEMSEDSHFIGSLYVSKWNLPQYLWHLNPLLSLHPSEPWTMAYSKNSKMKFFYNKKTKDSTYEMPPNSAAPFQYVPAYTVTFLA